MAAGASGRAVAGGSWTGSRGPSACDITARPTAAATSSCKGLSAHSLAGDRTADGGPCQVESVQASERREARSVLNMSSLPLEGRCMERQVCLLRTVKWPLFQIMKKGADWGLRRGENSRAATRASLCFTVPSEASGVFCWASGLLPLIFP